MVCPYCNKQETNVVDSRKNNEGNSIRRRRECPKCNLRFTTYEKAAIGLFVQKRSGELQEFNYEKLYKGIENAFGGLDLNENSKLQLSVDNLTDERTEAYVYAVNDTSWRPRNWMQWIPPRTVSLKYSFSF